MSRPRVVFVHGQMTTGAQTWSKQSALRERWTVVVPELFDDDLERSDFEEHARVVAPMLEDGAHLVGHSYGGVVAAYAAALRPGSVLSLVLVETPAHSLLRGDPGVEKTISDYEELARANDDPEAFIRAHFASIGMDASALPSPLPAPIDRLARLFVNHRPPWEADFSDDALTRAPFPKLVISGGHNDVMERVSDVLAQRLGAERKVIEGRGHLVQRTGDVFNDTLEDFMRSA